ncbi:MAG: hypothetical protein LIP16_14830, partial [Clostridium sp.]|nr:hypothetical protein [Clostridium sp.]
MERLEKDNDIQETADEVYYENDLDTAEGVSKNVIAAEKQDYISGEKEELNRERVLMEEPLETQELRFQELQATEWGDRQLIDPVLAGAPINFVPGRPPMGPGPERPPMNPGSGRPPMNPG